MECGTGEFDLFRFRSVVECGHGGGGELGLFLVEPDGAVDPLCAELRGDGVTAVLCESVEDLVHLVVDLLPLRIVGVVAGQFPGLL